MNRRILIILVILSLVLSGCSNVALGGKTTVQLWHSWTDANEVALLEAAIEDFTEANPRFEVEPLSVPFDQLKNKYTTEASTGGGPDLLIGPKDWIGELTTGQLIVPLDEVASELLGDLNPAAVEANRFQGKVMALPESVEAVVLWYNKSMVASPPATTDDLLMMAADSGVALNTGIYHSVGLLFGHGGGLFDANQRCVFDEGSGVADYLAYMAKAAATDGVIADADGGKLDAAFKDKQVGMIFNGPWATGDYANALGAENLGVAPPLVIPATGKTFAPFLGTKNIFLSANTEGKEQEAALAMMAALVSAEVQAKEAIAAGHIPVNLAVTPADPIIAGIVVQTQSASYFPNEPEMGAVWGPAGDMITKVIEGQAAPADAAAEAAKTINQANNK